MEYQTPQGKLIIETHCSPERLQAMELAEGMGIFWHGDVRRQKEALVNIARQPESNVVVAHTEDDTIVGFLTILRPDPNERWGRDRIPGLLELGGIEVAPAWRGLGIARKLLEAAFGSGEYDDRIVFATAYSWCWDLEGLGLSISQYRQMLANIFAAFGFETYVTDDPNIRCYPGNVLAARVGPKAPLKLLRRFLGLLVEEQPEYAMW